MYSLSIHCVPFAHRLASHSSITVYFSVKTAIVLRRSGFSKELRRGTPSTGPRRVIRVRILVSSKPLFLKAPVLPRMLILIFLRRVATPLDYFLQIFSEREPLNEPTPLKRSN